MRAQPHVEIIAHRGASRDRLENTLAAFSFALEQGADAFELDVHATRDGVVVVHHDAAVAAEAEGADRAKQAEEAESAERAESWERAKSAERAERARGVEKANGSERAKVAQNAEDASSGRRLTINTVDYITLSAVRLRNGESIPTLEEVLALASGKATVYVEVKGLGIEEEVIACLNRHPDTPTAVHSFDHRIPHRIGTRNPRTPTGILSASYVLDLEHMIKAAAARDLWQQAALIDQTLIDTAHRSGARVVAWTENDVRHAAELVQMGVDAICTDAPRVMRVGLVAAGLLMR